MTRTPEQQAAALADIQKMFDADKAPPAAQPTPEAKPAEVVDAAPAATGDEPAATPPADKPAEQSATPKDEPAEKGRVPYKRFAEKNAEAKAAIAERDELKAKLAALEASAKKPEDKPKHWLDDILDGPEAEAPTTVKPELSAYEERLARIEAREAQAELNELLANAAKDYPNVPQHVFLSGLAAGKEVEDIVGEWDPAFEHIGQLYVKQHGYQKGAPAQAEKPKPDTMPRLGGAPAPLVPETEKNKYAPGTAQHRATAIEWMKRHGF